MQICKVIGNVWSTKKHKELEGAKLMIVRPVCAGRAAAQILVAADSTGAGIGDTVLVVTGSAARVTLKKDMPIDAAIVGIVDSQEISE